MSRFLIRMESLLLALMMLVGLVPVTSFAATDNTTDSATVDAALEKAYAYIDALTVNSNTNDPETVVATFKTHFTWDNEKRENSKSYLYDWSYYNGVVFEGIQYLYEATGEAAYKDYVVEYMDALIADGGTWAVCSNNSNKTCAGYDATHGADCYKTASMLVDAWKLTGEEKYLTIAQSLYDDLTTAEATYCLEAIGYNFRHTWASDPSPDLWLDGLYMILPFRAEYAKHIGDTEELNQIVSRLTWVSANMRSDNGLFYHAADSATSNSGTFWLRSIGWYAAAIADVMDSVEGENRTALQGQLKLLADGMAACQNASNGMWLNNMAAAQSDTNPYETSGTALVCYAILKGVNRGWLDESYAGMALKAFLGICNEKLSGDTLTDICFKGVPSGSNSTFYDNEGKGVGPFIMLTAEVQRYLDSLEEEPEETQPVETEPVVTEPVVTEPAVTEPEETEPAVTDQIITDGVAVTVTVSGVADTLVGALLSEESRALLSAEGYAAIHVLNVTGTVADGETPVVSVSIPEGWDVNRVVGVYIHDGVLTEIEGAVLDGVFSFTVPGFSDVGIALAAESSVSGTGNLVGSSTYQLDSNTVSTNTKYLIVNTNSNGTAYALTNKNGTVDRTAVTISNGKITVADDSAIAWVFSGSESGTIKNRDHFLHYNNGLTLSTNQSTTWTVNDRDKDVYRIIYGKQYIRYRDDVWSASTSTNNSRNLYLFELVDTTPGGTVTFTLTPGSGTILVGKTLNLSSVVTLNGNPVDNCTIVWSSSDTNVATVNNGTVTGKADGTAKITATLTHVNGSALVSPIELTSEITVRYADVQMTLAPADATIKPGETVTFKPTVTVDGTSVDLNDCNITWSSSKDSVATVDENGMVTGVADGNVTITAELTRVDDVTLKESVAASVPVTVRSKTVTGTSNFSTAAVQTWLHEEPQFGTKVSLQVTYDDGSSDTVYVGTRLTVSGYNVEVPGVYPCDVFFDGTRVGHTVVRVVEDLSKAEDATSVPEYPSPGAVRFDKNSNELFFNETGVVRVDLDVAGISIRQAVNVLLIMDISNSMSWNDETYNYNDTAISTGSAQRLNIARDSAKEFVTTLLGDGESDEDTNNTLTLLAFAGIDGDFNDHNTAADNDDVYQLGDLAMTDAAAATAALDQLVKATTGGTNYDYAFQQAYELSQDLYEYNGYPVYIVFMTDGAPTHYNGVYYKSRSNTDLTALMNYVDPVTGETSRYTSTGYDRNENDIDYTAKTDITVYYNDGTTGTKNVTYNKGWSDYVLNNKNGWAEKVKALDYVAHVYCVGFGLENGSVTQGATSSMPTLDGVNGGNYYIPHDTTHGLLEHLASDRESHFEAENKDKLSELYKQIAVQIRSAGSSAQISDLIGGDFTLQMGSIAGDGESTVDLSETDRFGDYFFSGGENTDQGLSITLNAYDLYSNGSFDENGKDITGSRIEDSKTIVEQVTFNAEGTKAYSSLIDGGNTNIMRVNPDGSIEIDAVHFTYTKTADGEEDFIWHIGTISDKELELSFFSYMKGSLDGVYEKGLYHTNGGATLDYIDVNGKHVHHVFPDPQVVWQGASTAYEFYLVNKDGQPVNSRGQEIPFANRIIVAGPFYEEVNLFSTVQHYSVEAKDVLPMGYTLHDDKAYYKVIPGVQGSFQMDSSGSTVLVSYEADTYNQTRVAFGVLYDEIDAEIPETVTYILGWDTVVIDYCKPIKITLVFPENVQNPELIGLTRYTSGTDLDRVYTEDFLNANIFPIENPITTFQGVYGTFSCNGNDIVYTPGAFVSGVERVFAVMKIADNQYMVNPVAVIPATSMYYEVEGNANGQFTFSDGDWERVGDAVGSQDSYAPGGVYGYDSYFDTNRDFSSDGYWKAKGQGVETTTVRFTFTGTGFDIISKTNPDQATIRVWIYAGSDTSGALKETISLILKGKNDLMQLPVVSVDDLPFGTYTVVIGVFPEYDPDQYPIPDSLKETLRRGDQFYFDALRIYDPVHPSVLVHPEFSGDQAQIPRHVVGDVYKTDGEYNPEIKEIGKLLVDGGSIVSGEGILFIDDYDDGGVDIYDQYGPNHEVYLEKGQGIAFIVSASGGIPASLDIGAKTIQTDTTQLSAWIFADSNGDSSAAPTLQKDITSNTTQNFDLMAGSSLTLNEVFAGDQKAYVVIKNTGDGILSITDLKIAYDTSSLSRITLLVDEPLMLLAKSFSRPPVGEDHTHTYEAVVTAPTCVENGFTTYTCACGDSYVADEMPATGHSFGLWQIETEAVYGGNAGIKYRICQCGAKETTTYTTPLADVTNGKYFTKAVFWAYENGITTGTGDGSTFSPENVCTRKQIVTFLWRAAGEPEPRSMVNPFTDVKSDRFEKAILWAYYEGITSGTGDGSTFSPEATCTRKQIVTFLWRYKGQPQPQSMENKFVDVKNDRFTAAILWAAEQGITTGTGDGTTFSPENPCTRKQIVTFLYRATAQQ